MPDGYNGYTNYETWATALWIDNDEWAQNYALELAEQNEDVSDLAGALQDWIVYDEGIAMLPDLGSSLAADLLGTAVSAIDWHDLAETYKTVLAEQTA